MSYDLLLSTFVTCFAPNEALKSIYFDSQFLAKLNRLFLFSEQKFIIINYEINRIHCTNSMRTIAIAQVIFSILNGFIVR